MAQISDAFVQDLLSARRIGSLATENSDGSIHIVAVWYFYDGGAIYIATSSRSRKAQNLRARSKVSLMIDSRHPSAQRGIGIMGTARLLTDVPASDWNAKIHRKYLSSAALADVKVGPVFEALDDVTIQIVPSAVIAWDMREADRQFFGGVFRNNPEYLLPVEI